MSADVIKDFFVSLGFQIDDAGARKFEATLKAVTLQAAKVAVAVEASALAVVAFTAKIASGLDNLYWAGQRTGATVQGIQQLGYAVSQMGGSVEAARSSLESLAQFMRNSPGSEGFLNRLGVQTRDASGNMRDMASIFTGVGQRLSSMPYYRANQYAQMLGIDENTLMAMRRGMGQFSAQYSQMAKAIGYNADVAAVSSNKFMTSLNAFGTMAGMARDKIGSNLAEGLSGSLDNLRKLVLDNFPKIEGVITSSIKGLLWLADVIGRVIFRLVQAAGEVKGWWEGLDKGTQQLIQTLGLLVVAWRTLNSAFLASPIGKIALLAGSLFLLYDDYKAWKEGGKHLIDWESWEPQINAAMDAIDKLWSGIKRLKDEILDLFGIDPKTWSIKFEFDSLSKQFGELGKMLDLIGKLLNAIDDGRWSDAASYAKQLLHHGSDQPDALPGVTKSAESFRARYNALNNKLNEYLPEWLGGTPGAASSAEWESAWGSAYNMGGASRNLPDRNNNPGNIRSVATGGFRAFGSALEGWQAMKNQLMRYFTGKTTGRQLRTLTDIISTWAPPNENNTGKYIADVSQWMGVSPQAALNLTNPNVMTSLMQSMARKEGYTGWNSPQAAQAAGASFHQETNITVHGARNAQETADMVADKQNVVNARTLQALGGSY